MGVSLCMADISGIVTDTGSTPISGAVVQLEKGGQPATTGADGRFTLVASAVIFHGKSTLLPNGLSAGIAGNLMIVTISERSAVEVGIFDLNGKSLSIVRKTLDAGTHFLSLPYRGTGIFLYKVKSGTGEVVLKGNSMGVASSGSAVSPQGLSSNPLAKKALNTAAFNDVIAATKTGYLNYRVVVYNSDTSGIAIKMIASAGMVTDADGNVYQTVKIGNQVWTVENLRTTKYNDGSAIPLDTSIVTWNATTPKYCFYNNTTNADSINNYGALYNWYVVNPTNLEKVAPTGWHVPSDSEWIVLEKYLVLNGYNWDGITDTAQGNKIAKSLAAKADWHTNITTGTVGCDLTKNNMTGFSALPGGCRDNDGSFSGQRVSGSWWSVTEHSVSTAYGRDLSCVSGNLGRYGDYGAKSCGFSVRLLRD
jgi:uncharacterized protein (TIGR02145 family)